MRHRLPDRMVKDCGARTVGAEPLSRGFHTPGRRVAARFPYTTTGLVRQHRRRDGALALRRRTAPFAGGPTSAPQPGPARANPDLQAAELETPTPDRRSPAHRPLWRPDRQAKPGDTDMREK